LFYGKVVLGKSEHPEFFDRPFPWICSQAVNLFVFKMASSKQEWHKNLLTTELLTGCAGERPHNGQTHTIPKKSTQFCTTVKSLVLENLVKTGISIEF